MSLDPAVLGGVAGLAFARSLGLELLGGETGGSELSEVGFLFLSVHGCFLWYVLSMTYLGSKVKG